MEKNISGHKYFEEESSDAFAVTAQEVLVNEEKDQLEELIYEPTVETVETCSFQTDKFYINAGMIHDDD